jgi:hypothetical protein
VVTVAAAQGAAVVLMYKAVAGPMLLQNGQWAGVNTHREHTFSGMSRGCCGKCGCGTGRSSGTPVQSSSCADVVTEWAVGWGEHAQGTRIFRDVKGMLW